LIERLKAETSSAALKFYNLKHIGLQLFFTTTPFSCFHCGRVLLKLMGFNSVVSRGSQMSEKIG